MNTLTAENNKRFNIKDVPQTSIEELRENIKRQNRRPAGFFGVNEGSNTRLYVILADDKAGKFFISSILFTEEMKSYPSLTQDFPSFFNFEREFYEEFNIEPLNHPHLKPLRNNQDNYRFFEMKGEEIHEVSVGPIHAGIIEPGHFRFQCRGEKVYELEIMLGYQHRGIEKLFTEEHNNCLAESVSGDSVISYSMAYSQLIEALSDTQITPKAEIIRRIALELERTAVHLGDLGAIAGDTAYLQPAAVFAAARTPVINTMLEISGSRFGRGLIETGGVNFDIDDAMSEKIAFVIDEALNTAEYTVNIMLKKPSFLSRIEKTGFVPKSTALAIGACGMAARASGAAQDSRIDFKDKWYENIEHIRFHASGGVYARFYLRYLEIKQSAGIIKELLEKLKEHKTDKLKIPLNPIIPNSAAVSITEGWRGEIIHTALTDENGRIIRYKIKDPSFNNWHMLSLAVRNAGISDFPLCNKSFNLSYSGHDL